MIVIGRTEDSDSLVFRINFLFKRHAPFLSQIQIDISMRGNYCLHQYNIHYSKNHALFQGGVVLTAFILAIILAICF